MWPRSVWPRTCHLQFASPFIIRCAARLVIAFKTVLLMVSDVTAVSLGIWLASVPPFNHLLLPLLVILSLFPVPILQFLPMKKRTSRISLTFLPLSLVPVLVTTSAPSCSHFCVGFQFQEACCFGCTSSVFSGDSRVFGWVPRRSPGQRQLDELQSQSDSPSPSRSPFLLLQSPILHLQSLLLQSPLFPASFKCIPASEKPVSATAKSSGCLSTYWEVSSRSGSGYIVFECPDSQLFWDFGSLSRSIEEVDTISFEYTIVSWNMFVVRFRGRKRLLCGVSLLFLKMLLTPCLLVGRQVPWTVICFVPRLIRCWCIRPPPAVLMFLLPRILFIGELGGLGSPPPPIPVHCLWCVLWLLLVFCLAPLHSSHWGMATHLKIQKKQKKTKKKTAKMCLLAR